MRAGNANPVFPVALAVWAPVNGAMMENSLNDTLTRAASVFADEVRAIEAAAARISEPFHQAVELIVACKGRVILTGMGKHGLIARKIAATLASTGTPAVYMNAGEARHGDLGMIEPADLVLALSNSGNTEEVLGCIPYFKRNGNVVIAMTGNLKSELARNSDVILDVSVEREACPLNLAPTTSATVALVMGDALAVVLLERRGFRQEDFAMRHPGGTLGKRLLLRVGDIMRTDLNPTVPVTSTFETAIAQITSSQRGAVSIIDANGVLAGILTDGDLRRIFQRAAADSSQTVASVLSRPVRDMMTADPVHVTPDTLAAKAMHIMENGRRKIFVLPVLDEERHPIAMIHLHDLVAAGV